MKSLSANPPAPRGSRRQPEASRNAILQAALAEFAQEGLAGARVDAIAEAAGVNKALLYYYFHDKETLYGAMLDRFFARLLDRMMTVCDRPGTAGERFLSYAQRALRFHRRVALLRPHLYGRADERQPRRPTHLDRIFAQYIQPIGMRVLGLLQEGIDSGEFRAGGSEPVRAVGHRLHRALLSDRAAAAEVHERESVEPKSSRSGAPRCSTSLPPHCSRIAMRASSWPPKSPPRTYIPKQAPFTNGAAP